MRLDRAFSLYAVHPFRQIQSFGRRAYSGWAKDELALPVLMYHSISDAAETVPPYYRTITRPARFAEQMTLLHERGWQGVTLSTGLRSLADNSARSLVALTFDDGFHDFYSNAAPVLRNFGFSATMYLATGFVGSKLHNRDCLTWSEVQELRSAGVEFGSHTVTHRKLLDLSWSQIEHEVFHSKAEIEERLGNLVTAFAYPYAFPQACHQFAARLREILVTAGYHSCVTTEIGRAKSGEDQFRIKRLPVNSADDSALFTAKLDGAYDWLGLPQRKLKSIKALSHRLTERHLDPVQDRSDLL